MAATYPGGSTWRKWDLQIHTPASHLNNGFGTNWDDYVQRLFRALIEREIAVVGVTDYFTIDGYKELKRYLADEAKMKALFSDEERAKIAAIRLLPNVEFRLSRFVGESRINAHVIFSDALTPTEIEDNFLHNLDFTYQNLPQQNAEKFRLKIGNLEELGKKLIAEHKPFENEGGPIRVGMMNAVVDDDDISKALQATRFKERYLFGVVPDEDLADIDWNSQDHHSRKLLVQKSDILFSSNPKTRNWGLAQPPQYREGRELFCREFGSLKPCVHGSDAHGPDEIAHPCARRGDKKHSCKDDPEGCDLRFCWIKADPTFEGLRQILHEPADRVFIGPTAPVYHDEARVIRAVNLSDGSGWFDDQTIPINAALVSIIGQKGSGKSALAELMAFAAGSWEASETTSFINRAKGHLHDLNIELQWGDGSKSNATLSSAPGSDRRVRYLSQNFVERLCAQDGVGEELIAEIENVVFSYIDPTETLNASNFRELRALKTDAIRSETERLRSDMLSVIRIECALRESKARLPEKRARDAALKEERVGLEKQIPAATSPEEEKIRAELLTIRTSLSAAQQAAAADKHTLQKIADVRARVAAFKGQMGRFYADLEPLLREVGIPDASLNAFQPSFALDNEAPLAARSATIQAQIAQREGAIPPADGTIKWLELKIKELSDKESADKARQQRIRQIQTRIAAIDTERARIAVEIAQIEGPDEERIKQSPGKRLQAYVAFFENMTKEQATLQALYEPISGRLNQEALLDERQLEFSIRWEANLKDWLERGGALMDQRRRIPYETFEKLGEAARLTLLPAWSSGKPQEIGVAIDQFIEKFRDPQLPWTSYAKTGVTLQDILEWLYEVQHIKLNYGLRFNGSELETLSPGTKGIVLLILYLGVDAADTRPLIVDQPDENLDNESIYTLLMPYFRRAKGRRQIIMITHNPNLVVNADSEQVIVATATRRDNGLPHINYDLGSLEDSRPPLDGIREQVCRILEGGEEAFRKREERYSLS